MIASAQGVAIGGHVARMRFIDAKIQHRRARIEGLRRAEALGAVD